MVYTVKEMYHTLQGEGSQVGRAAVFLRFSGCNLWTGREAGREKAVCKFCDTQFVGTDGEGGGRFKTAEEVSEAVARAWSEAVACDTNRYVVCTGGEPCLQLDEKLVVELHRQNFEVGVETNGTLNVPAGVDWICVSPKAGSELRQTHGDELKLVYPQMENRPEDFEHLDFKHFFLSPRDLSFEPSSYEDERHPAISPTEACIDYCLKNPQWRLSLQTHKILKLK